MSKNGGGGICRILNTLAGLALLGAGGYMIWHFMGRPNSKDIKASWENFGGFGDFSDVLGYVLSWPTLFVYVCIHVKSCSRLTAPCPSFLVQ